MEYGDKVSVVMPVYNRAHLMARVVPTILTQSYENLELLVVDDGSSDDIEGALAAFADPRIRLVRRAENGGVAAARNTGIAEAASDWIAFHDSDDYCTPERLALSVRTLCDLPDDYIGLYGARMIYNDVSEASYSRAHVKQIPRAGENLLSGDLAARTAQGNIINFPTLMAHRDAMVAAGLLDELLRQNEDWDFCLRLTRQGKIGFVPEPLILTPTSLDPDVSAARVSRSVRQSARSFMRITSKMRRQRATAEVYIAPAALAGHYLSTGRHLMRLDRVTYARRFFRAALALSPGQPRTLLHYTLSFAPGLHRRLRRDPVL